MKDAASYFVIIDRRDRAPVFNWLPVALRRAPAGDHLTVNTVDSAQGEVEPSPLDSLLNDALKREP